MNRSTWINPYKWAVGLALVLLIGPMAALRGQNTVAPDDTPAEQRVVSVEVAVGSGDVADFELIGSDARQQLVVTGRLESGEPRDLTRAVRFVCEPEGIVDVSGQGVVAPLAEGEASIRALGPGGIAGEVRARVSHFKDEVPINFPNQIVPIFTKLGCNGGGCHGKASGQNGFRLSLLGFEPAEDYEHLLMEARGRRLFPAAPERSLLLLKGTGQIPHGGGARLEPTSRTYGLLVRWIAQGMPYGEQSDPVVREISIYPQQRILPRGAQQQLAVTATYTDGTTEDVTGMVQFEINESDMAECSPAGLVQIHNRAGDLAVMARYQGHVAVFRATIPLGQPVTEIPSARNFIDELVFAKLDRMGLPPSGVCDDSTFLRRASIDIAGRLPTVEETIAFLQDPSPDKRDRWIDRLVDSPAYADLFANKWSAILRNQRPDDRYKRGSFALHAWLRDNLYENRPYSDIVRDILTASGEVGVHPPVVWYRSVRKTEEQVEDSAQLFLGLRLQCARCHHHPFEKWSQHDYYSLAAFFSRVGRKDGEQPEEYRVFHRLGTAQATNPKTKKAVRPAGLDGEPLNIPSYEDPREALVAWMTDPANPFFSKSLVNRYWKHFFHRGLVEPEDDMRVTNPATNPDLLEALARHFVESGFDLKNLVRTICKSNAYQLSSEPNAFNGDDQQNFSRYYPRRLQAEVLLDAVDATTATTTQFGGLPAGTRAVQLPDAEFGSYFLTVFGRPQATTACECERSGEANLAQSLHMLNSTEIQQKLSAEQGRAARLSKMEDRSPEDRIREIYLVAYSRYPTKDEVGIALDHLAKMENKQQAYEDLLWAILNSKEFLFNH